MHEFGSVTTCPKCGRSAGGCWNVEWVPEKIERYVSLLTGVLWRDIQPAHMKRTCMCGYSWREKPKDAPKEGQA